MPTVRGLDEGVHHDGQRPEAGADAAEDREPLDLLVEQVVGEPAGRF